MPTKQKKARARCGSCGEPIDESADVPIEDRVPCPQCGSTTRKFSEHLKVKAKAQVGLKFKHKRPGSKKPITEGFTGRDLRKSVGDFVDKEQRFDRGKDRRYREKIVTDSGEVIRDVDEPLSEHRNRGSAKFKKT